MKKAVLGILLVLAVGSDAFDWSSLISWITKPADWAEPSSELAMRFSVGLDPGVSFFIKLPMNKSLAVSDGWVETKQPGNISDMRKNCVMYCKPPLNTVCMMYDQCAGLVGLQISLAAVNLTTPFNLEKVGFKWWYPTIFNETTPALYTEQYFVSKETLSKSCTQRTSSYNASKILQDGNVYVPGIDGQLLTISENGTQVEAEGVFKEQSCIPWMGKHYFYNMTSSLPECSEKTMPTWFTMTTNGKSKKTIGVCMVLPGKYPIIKGIQDFFERPPRFAVEAIAPHAPKCMSEMVDKHGILTSHIYLIKPMSIYC